MNKIWTEEKIIDNLSELIKKLGKFPTCQEIRDYNQTLLHAIYKSKTINYYRELLGHKEIKKSNGYWTEDIICSKIKEIIKNNNNNFPVKKYFKENGETLLFHAIGENGGINHFRELLGFSKNRKSKGYWTWENAEKELREFCLELGDRFPTKRDFIAYKKYALQNAIHIYFGGICSVRAKMGYEARLETRDGHAVSSSYEFIFDEFLFSHGIEHSFNNFIDLSSGRKFRYDFKIGDIYFEIWGYDYKGAYGDAHESYIKRKNEKIEFYKERNFTLQHIYPEFFNCEDEKINTNLEKLFKSLGFNLKKYKPFEVFKIKNTIKSRSIKNVLEDLKSVIKELNHFPKQIELTGQWSYLKSATFRLGGGLNYFKALIEHPDKDPNEILKIKFESKKAEEQQIIKLYKETLSTSEVMKITGFVYHKIYDCLVKNNIEIHNERVYSDEEFIEELKFAIKELKLNHFPTLKELRCSKFSNLSKMIVKRGGTNKFREILGYELYNRRSSINS